MRLRFRTSAALITIAVAGLLAGAAPAGATGRPTEPSLTGTALLYRLDGQEVHFTFDAHGFAQDAHGTFRYTHRAGDLYGWAEAEVDCLMTGGPVAILTGVVTASNVPQLIGKRQGISVYDNGRHDRLGYSWALTEGPGGPDVPFCVSVAPFETTRTGDFTVEHWMPPLPR